MRGRSLLICLGLAIVTAGVYWPVSRFEFLTFDDPDYVTDNVRVRQGLTVQNVGWALTTDHAGNWFPLVWISLMLDCQLFGTWAGGYHLVNVLLHVANTLLLFFLLQRVTAATWRSAAVSALFALHPLHVESVAWITERKDVLSTFFLLLALRAYVGYVQAPARARYAGAVGLYALSLMSKQMGVTLPFVLLLLDYWPLGRTRWAKPATGQAVESPLAKLIREKVPFFALAAASSVVAYWAQHRAGAVSALEGLPLGMRIGNALLSYVGYVGKMLWPAGLSVFYPLPAQWPMAWVALAGVGLGAMTLLVIGRAGRQPWLLTGWFWYLGTLVPVIGLVQVGAQAMADRYTYVPLIGLFVMLCWSLPATTATACAAVAVIAACAAWTRVQLGYWKDSETLFRHALSVTRDNWQAHFNLGVALNESGRDSEAIVEYRRALRIRPWYVEAHNNLGATLWREGDAQGAIAHWQEALRIRPELAEAHKNLGFALRQQGRMREAIEHYRQALQAQPNDAQAHNGLGSALMRLDRVSEAIEHFERTVQIQPSFAEARNNLGAALVKVGRIADGIEQLEQALRLRPDYALAHYNLGVALEEAGRTAEAVKQYQRALQLDGGLTEARDDLARIQSTRQER